MKKIALVAASMLIAGSASAADLSYPVKAPAAEPPAPLWDVAFGVKLTTDYVFRGITQTSGNAAVQGYAELQAFDWFYAGIFGSNVSFLYDGSAEIDLYGGLRHSWDALTLDVGFVYYAYPGGMDPTTGWDDTDYNYWEIYFKPSYVFADVVTVGGNLFYGDSYAGTGASETYLSGTLKIDFSKYSTVPDLGFYVSGEVGYQWLGTTTEYFPGTNYTMPDYATWNVGVGFTYKAATLDLRYSDSDLSGYQCGLISGATTACGDRYVASLSFDTSFNKLK